MAKRVASRLLFMPFGQEKSGAGKPIPSARVPQWNAGEQRVTRADRSEYRSARVHQRENGAARRIAKATGLGELVSTLRRLYPSAGEAREAARAELVSLMRGNARLSITLYPGNPLVAAEVHLELVDFRSGINDIWLCKAAKHMLTACG